MPLSRSVSHLRVRFDDPLDRRTDMSRIRQRIATWIGRWTRADLAAFAGGVIVIAVVPGGLVAWIAWRFLRGRAAA
jgi:hypothetical protein